MGLIDCRQPQYGSFREATPGNPGTKPRLVKGVQVNWSIHCNIWHQTLRWVWCGCSRLACYVFCTVCCRYQNDNKLSQLLERWWHHESQPIPNPKLWGAKIIPNHLRPPTGAKILLKSQPIFFIYLMRIGDFYRSSTWSKLYLLRMVMRVLGTYSTDCFLPQRTGIFLFFLNFDSLSKTKHQAWGCELCARSWTFQVVQKLFSKTFQVVQKLSTIEQKHFR